MIDDAVKHWLAGVAVIDIGPKVGATYEQVRALIKYRRHLFPERMVPSAVTVPTNPAAKWPEKAPGFAGVPIGRLGAGYCHFPLWGHHERFDPASSLYCGAPQSSAPGRYCAFHDGISRGDGTPGERRAVKDAARLGKVGA